MTFTNLPFALKFFITVVELIIFYCLVGGHGLFKPHPFEDK